MLGGQVVTIFQLKRLFDAASAEVEVTAAAASAPPAAFFRKSRRFMSDPYSVSGIRAANMFVLNDTRRRGVIVL
mgnify:CR=1 FL=1